MRVTSKRSIPSADSSWRIGIVCSSFYKEEVQKLVDAAVETLRTAGVRNDHISVYWVPGSFEIPLIGRELGKGGDTDALLAFGIIVDGETHHAQHLSEQVARGIMDVQLEYGIPFAFEVLSVKTIAQARKRATGKGNKGEEAAVAALQTLHELKAIRGGNR